MSTIPHSAGLGHLQYFRRPAPPAATAALLGGLCYGWPAGGEPPNDSAPWAPLDASLMSPMPCVDTWQVQGPMREGRHGRVAWRQSGAWLFGVLRLDEAAFPELDLTTLARLGYREVFEALDAEGGWHLLRIWNYLPRINAIEGPMERYRQFNAGRQLAFQDHGRDTQTGSPAACALGTHRGPVCVYFLAGRTPSTRLENPRQVPAYHYPTAFGPRSPTFSRACLITPQAGECLLLISGTASIVGHESVHHGDVRAQTLETVRNLQAVIDTAHTRTTARFKVAELCCTVYVRRAADAPLVRATLIEALGAEAPALRDMVLLEADICREELLLEIEAHMGAPGELVS